MVYKDLLQRQQLIETLYHAGIHDKRVLAALADIPREMFVDESMRKYAYTDQALPINMGQTISQPLMVAVMTQALQLMGHERVLEIGTGSGFQTAVLSRLAMHVYSVERYQQLAYTAAKRIRQLDIKNVSLYVGDGTLGWAEEAPYDRILVTAAAPDVPSPLFEQLAMGGLMVIPVGGTERQELQVIRRSSLGKQVRTLGSCVFVPLIGESGWSEQVERAL